MEKEEEMVLEDLDSFTPLLLFKRSESLFCWDIFEVWVSEILHNSRRISDVASKNAIRPLHKKWKQVLGVEVSRGSLFCHWRYLSSDLSPPSISRIVCEVLKFPSSHLTTEQKRRELFASSQKRERRKPLSARSKGFLFSRLKCAKIHQFLRGNNAKYFLMNKNYFYPCISVFLYFYKKLQVVQSAPGFWPRTTMDKSPFLFFSSSFHCGTRCAVGWVGARLFGWVVWSGAGRADMPFLLLPYCKTLNLDGILTTTFAFPRISRRISKKRGRKKSFDNYAKWGGCFDKKSFGDRRYMPQFDGRTHPESNWKKQYGKLEGFPEKKEMFGRRRTIKV